MLKPHTVNKGWQNLSATQEKSKHRIRKDAKKMLCPWDGCISTKERINTVLCVCQKERVQDSIIFQTRHQLRTPWMLWTLRFFPNGSSSLGRLCDMQIRLGNFQQQVLDVLPQQNHISKNKFTKTMLYLSSKEKSRSQKIRDLSTENLL